MDGIPRDCFDLGDGSSGRRNDVDPYESGYSEAGDGQLGENADPLGGWEIPVKYRQQASQALHWIGKAAESEGFVMEVKASYKKPRQIGWVGV
jgi:hypothetical protein